MKYVNSTEQYKGLHAVLPIFSDAKKHACDFWSVCLRHDGVAVARWYCRHAKSENLASFATNLPPLPSNANACTVSRRAGLTKLMEEQRAVRRCVAFAVQMS